MKKVAQPTVLYVWRINNEQGPRSYWRSRFDEYKEDAMTEMAVADAQLIKETFLSPWQQLLTIRHWNAARGWGFTEEDFARLGNIPSWPAIGVPVLDVQLRSLYRTVTETYELLKQVHSEHEISSEFRFTKPNLRLAPGCTHKRGLRWRVVNLGFGQGLPIESAYSGKKAIRPEFLPSTAILWAAVLHPQWVQSMNG
ncbi:hypothetical protein IIA94_01975, partial [Patescibacteria group bacterium]|nr:hypothetical protein [Patescibacteria group bacterium]